MRVIRICAKTCTQNRKHVPKVQDMIRSVAVVYLKLSLHASMYTISYRHERAHYLLRLHQEKERSALK